MIPGISSRPTNEKVGGEMTDARTYAPSPGFHHWAQEARWKITADDRAWYVGLGGFRLHVHWEDGRWVVAKTNQGREERFVMSSADPVDVERFLTQYLGNSVSRRQAQWAVIGPAESERIPAGWTLQETGPDKVAVADPSGAHRAVFQGNLAGDDTFYARQFSWVADATPEQIRASFLSPDKTPLFQGWYSISSYQDGCDEMIPDGLSALVGLSCTAVKQAYHVWQGETRRFKGGPVELAWSDGSHMSMDAPKNLFQVEPGPWRNYFEGASEEALRVSAVEVGLWVQEDLSHQEPVRQVIGRTLLRIKGVKFTVVDELMSVVFDFGDLTLWTVIRDEEIILHVEHEQPPATP